MLQSCEIAVYFKEFIGKGFYCIDVLKGFLGDCIGCCQVVGHFFG